jgi:hypothetical protein
LKQNARAPKHLHGGRRLLITTSENVLYVALEADWKGSSAAQLEAASYRIEIRRTEGGAAANLLGENRHRRVPEN